MSQRMSRIRRALSLFMSSACSLAVVGLLLIYFGTQGRSWERAIATELGGWPWSFGSPLIDPTGEANALSCDLWYRARESGWRVGVFHGAVIFGRNRSFSRPAARELHFLSYGIQVAHGTVYGPYYFINATHFSSTCEPWMPDWVMAGQVAQAAMFSPVNTTIIFPAWVPVPFLAIFPIHWFLTGPWRTYCRRRKGLCVNCAYNLTGNTSGTCPECGMHCPARRAA